MAVSYPKILFKMSGRPRTTSLAETGKSQGSFGGVKVSREYMFKKCTSIWIQYMICTFQLEKIYLETLCHELNMLFTGFIVRKGDKDGGKVTTVIATSGSLPDRTQEISYADTKVIGNGSFGVVYQARLCEGDQPVAIKKVLQDKRFKVQANFTSPTEIKAAGIICQNASSLLKFSQFTHRQFHVFSIEQRTSNYEKTGPL